MMKYFDYLYYRLCVWCRARSKGRADFVITAYVIVSVFECFNFTALSVAPDIIFRKILFNSVLGRLIPVAIIFIFNFRRYDKKPDFYMLEELYRQEPAKTKFVRGVWLVLYLITSVALLVVAAMVLDGQSWNQGK